MCFQLLRIAGSCARLYIHTNIGNGDAADCCWRCSERGARVQNMKRAIKEIVGRGPNAVALREFHRRLNSGVRLRSSLALRWAFNLEAQTGRRGRIITPKMPHLCGSVLFCVLFIFSTRSLSRSSLFFAQSITRLIFLIGM